MAIQFPTSPILNEVYTNGEKTWYWDGIGWRVKTPAYLAALNSFRNKVINGDMRIDQRNIGTAVSIAAGVAASVYPVDRTYVYKSGNAAISAQQLTSGAPAGFSHYMRVTITTGATLASDSQIAICHLLEGYSCVDLAYGTSSAKTITASLNVRASVAGTYAYRLYSGSTSNKSYVGTFQITNANMWETKVIPIPGLTSATLDNLTNGSGLAILINLACSSTYNAPSINNWVSGNYLTTPSAVSLYGTTGATFDITGLSIIPGIADGAFEYRPYPIELAMCQRFFEKSYPVGVAPGTLTFAGAMGQRQVSTNLVYSVPFKTPKRVTPTIVYYNPVVAANGTWRDINANTNITVATGGSTSGADENQTTVTITGTNGNLIIGHYTASAEFV